MKGYWRQRSRRGEAQAHGKKNFEEFCVLTLRFCPRIALLSEGVSHDNALGAENTKNLTVWCCICRKNSTIPKWEKKFLRFDVANREKISPYQSEGYKAMISLWSENCEVANLKKIHPYKSEGKNVSTAKNFNHTKVRRFGRINGDKIHSYKSGKRTGSQQQENFNVTSTVKIHPYKSEEERVSNAK